MTSNRLLVVLRLTALHAALTVALAYALYVFLPESTASFSFFVGGMFFAADFFIMGLTWGLIFSKKYIALAIGVSVIKFSILGVILFELIVRRGIHPVFFSLGCAIFVLTALIEALLTGKLDRS